MARPFQQHFEKKEQKAKQRLAGDTHKRIATVNGRPAYEVYEGFNPKGKDKGKGNSDG